MLKFSVAIFEKWAQTKKYKIIQFAILCKTCYNLVVTCFLLPLKSVNFGGTVLRTIKRRNYHEKTSTLCRTGGYAKVYRRF